MISVAQRIREAGFPTTPRPFQIKGIRFIEQHKGRCILGDSMGLGKTYQSLTYLALNPHTLPVVIICPASVKLNWQRELLDHAGLRSQVLETRKTQQLKGNIWIINFDILESWKDTILAAKPNSIVIDECQMVVNPQSKRALACKAVARKCDQVIGLSGTPILNGPVEFFSILNMVAPDDFNSYIAYGFRYCNPRMVRGKWDFKGASNVQELHERIKPYMIRRMKTEVAKDLPLKSRTIIPVKIDLKEYEKAKREFILWVGENQGRQAAMRARSAQAVVKVGYLKRIAALGKLKTVVEWIREFRQTTGQKLAVFAVHHLVVDALLVEFPHALVITGKTKPAARQNVVDLFQNDPDKWLYIGNLEAGGVGVTLTAASTTVFIELGWVPAHHEQAEDRVLRIGQMADHVNAYYFLAKGTVDEWNWDLLELKREVVGRVVDGEDGLAKRSVQTRVIERLLGESNVEIN